MRVYLSGSMTLVEDGSEHKTWAEKAAAWLRGSGFSVWSPYEHELGDSVLPSEVVAMDLREIRKSDAVLCNASLPSWGAAQEIMKAHEWGLVVIAWCPEGIKRSQWLTAHCHAIYPTLAAAISAVENLQQKAA